MLGRGLESLIPPQNQPNDSDDKPQDGLGMEQTQPAATAGLANASSRGYTRKNSVVDNAIFQIEVDKIHPNSQQPRRQFDEGALRELASSIREFGVIQPLIVSKIETETEGGREVLYQLVAGERRLLAARLAGLDRVPVIIRQVMEDRERLELAIIENLQREDLNPIESARAFAKLQDQFGLTQREIASRLGKSRESIANSVRLLNLPSFVQEAIEQGQINESQGRLLLAVTDLASQERLFNELLKNNLSVRELRSKIKRTEVHAAEPENQVDDNMEPEVFDMKEKLETFFGAPVLVKKTGPSGKIIINFYSQEELQNIISKVAVQNDGAEREMNAGDESAEFVI